MNANSFHDLKPEGGHVVVGVIEIPVGPKRRPDRALADVFGQPLLWRIYERMKAARTLDKILIVTGLEEADQPIVDFAELHGIPCVADSEIDLVQSYCKAARVSGATAILRVAGDCPLVDPALIDETVGYFKAESDRFEYVTNCFKRTYPDGLDLDVFSTRVLSKIDKAIHDPFWRGWLINYMRDGRIQCPSRSLENADDFSALRWRADCDEGLIFANAVFSHLYPQNPLFLMTDVLDLLARCPELKGINRDRPLAEPPEWPEEPF